MSGRTSVVLVGIGGYGELYVSALLDEPQGSSCRIVGAVDPNPAHCSRLAELESIAVPIYQSLDEFYQQSRADLAVLSSPIQLHAEHTCQALAHGSHVLVEKPAAAVTADVDRMITARDAAGLIVAVGFQWSFSRSILRIKHDIMAGRFGEPIAGQCLTLWPRTESYYQRNDWAGRKRDAKGRWILDSPPNNAMAHFLHNLLFLLGSELDSSAVPTDITACLGRANDIETYDTIAAKVSIRNSVELLFLASHAIGEHEVAEPRFKLEFEYATVEFPGSNAAVTARVNDGTTVEYESPNLTPQAEKLWCCVSALVNGTGVPCRLETARPHTQCIDTIEHSAIEVTEFDASSIQRTDTTGGMLRWVPGLSKALQQAYLDGELPDLKGMT